MKKRLNAATASSAGLTSMGDTKQKFARSVIDWWGYQETLLIVFLILYGILCLLTLGRVPQLFVDEPWHTENAVSYMRSGEFGQMSFPSFNLGEPALHKYWVHVLIYRWFGFSLITMRLPSLIFSLGALIFGYVVAARLFSRWTALFFVVCLSLQIPFFHASHIARHEPMTLFFLTSSLALALFVLKRPVLITFFLGFYATSGIHIHPHGLMASFVSGMVAFYVLWTHRQSLLLPAGAFFAGIVLAFGLYFSVVSWDVFKYYMFYLGPLQKIPIGQRLFFLKLVWRMMNDSIFHYHVFVSFLSLVVTVLGLGYVAKRDFRQWRSVLILMVAAASAYLFLVIMGRQTPYYVVLLYPFYILAFTVGLNALLLKKSYRLYVLSAFIVFFAFEIVFYSLSFPPVSSYEKYRRQVLAVIPGNARVMGRIQHSMMFNTPENVDGSYFADIDFFRPYMLKKAGKDVKTKSIADYILLHNIDYIIMDHALEKSERKVFSDPVISNYVKTNGVLLATITNPAHGGRFYDELDSTGVFLPPYRPERKQFVTTIYDLTNQH